MSERLETLNKARARVIENRDTHAKVLAAPFDRDKAERARNKFIEIQALIDALALMRGQMLAIEDASMRAQCSIQFPKRSA
jgi:hypothetical protein